MASHLSVSKRMLRKRLERENLPEYLFKILKHGDPRRANDLRRFRKLPSIFNDRSNLWIQHVAISQWATVEYFRTIDTQFPNMKSLDLADISLLSDAESSAAFIVSSVVSYAPTTLERLDLGYLDVPIKTISTLLSPLAELPRLNVLGLKIGAWLRAVTTPRDGDSRDVSIPNYRSSDLFLQDVLCNLYALSDTGRFEIDSLDCVNEMIYSSQDLAEVFDLQNKQGFRIMRWFAATYDWHPLINFNRFFWTPTANWAIFEKLQELDIPVSLQVSVCEALNARALALDSVKLIAGMVDEFSIHMPFSIESRMTRNESSRSRFHWDIIAYSQFWQMFPHHFTKVHKVQICVPREVYDNWWIETQPRPLAGPIWHEIAYPDVIRVGAGRIAHLFRKRTFIRWLH
ncbi:MAG: hypothetical protein M1836_003470 [Candelina mexicana]|nr:MAG: hypothetical protein M1836_003470 [Candelina mexicana]